MATFNTDINAAIRAINSVESTDIIVATRVANDMENNRHTKVTNS